MHASVVVPTYLRPDFLDRCLQALIGAGVRSRSFEIIVADDAGSDTTQRQVEAWAGRSAIPIRYVSPVVGHGPAAARNAGWRIARGEIIAFTDDDCIPDLALACRGSRRLREWSRSRLGPGRSFPCRRGRPTTNEMPPVWNTAEFVTANCFVRRDVLVAVGGFDERFSAAWREDSDLHFALLQVGQRDRSRARGDRGSSGSPGALGSLFAAAAEEPVQRALVQEISRTLPPAYQVVASLGLLRDRRVAGHGPRRVGRGPAWVGLGGAGRVVVAHGALLRPAIGAEFALVSTRGRDARDLGTRSSAVGLLAALRRLEVSRPLPLIAVHFRGKSSPWICRSSSRSSLSASATCAARCAPSSFARMARRTVRRRSWSSTSSLVCSTSFHNWRNCSFKGWGSP